MLDLRASTLAIALVLTGSACDSTGAASSPTAPSSSEAAPPGRFAQCLSIRNSANAEDPTQLRAHAEALRALALDDDLRGPADALARSYDDLADGLNRLGADPTEPDSPTDVDSYLTASDRYDDASADVRSACRE